MRIGVVGTGSAGRRHIGNLLALGCSVSAMDCSSEARERAKAEYPTARVVECLMGDFAAFIIATPYDQHLGFVEAAIKRGTAFFIEKPLGLLEQLPRWREIAAMDLPVNQVGYQCRVHPKAQAMKLLFPHPDTGTFYCSVNMATWPGHNYGPFLLEASHEIDLACWLGAGDLLNASSHSFPRSQQVTLEFTGHDASRPWRVQLNNLEGTHYLRTWRVEEDAEWGACVQFHSPAELGDQMYRDELAHFLDCVRDGKPTLCPLADGLRVLEICDRVMREVPA